MKMPPKSMIEAAVIACQKNIGAAPNWVGIKISNRFYKKYTMAIERIAKYSGMNLLNVAAQIEAEALRRGAIQVQPGKDF